MMSDDPDDTGACKSIIESIEKRWASTDQEIFIAAIILNPFYRNTTFAPLNFLNNAGIRALLGHLWTRFYRTQPPDDFYTQVGDYLNQRGMFENLKTEVAVARVEAERKVCLESPYTNNFKN